MCIEDIDDNCHAEMYNADDPCRNEMYDEDNHRPGEEMM